MAKVTREFAVDVVEEALEDHNWLDANGEDLRKAAELVVDRLLEKGYLD